MKGPPRMVNDTLSSNYKQDRNPGRGAKNASFWWDFGLMCWLCEDCDALLDKLRDDRSTVDLVDAKIRCVLGIRRVLGS